MPFYKGCVEYAIEVQGIINDIPLYSRLIEGKV